MGQTGLPEGQVVCAVLEDGWVSARPGTGRPRENVGQGVKVPGDGLFRNCKQLSTGEHTGAGGSKVNPQGDSSVLWIARALASDSAGSKPQRCRFLAG